MGFIYALEALPPPSWRDSVPRAQSSTFTFFPPPNDNFTNRYTISGANNTSLGIQFASASAEPGEPHPFPASAWWEWTAPYTGTFGVTAFSSQYSAAGIYPIVFFGEEFSQLQQVSKPSSYSEKAKFDGLAGHTYYIALAGYAKQLNVSLRIQAAPVNDDLANASLLSPASPSASTLLGASTEPGEPPLPSTNSIGATIWWSWAPPDLRGYSFAVHAPGDGVVLEIFRRHPVGVLERASDFLLTIPGQTNRLTFRPATHETYFLRVTDTGLLVPVTIGIAPGPDNDDFIDASQWIDPARQVSTIGATPEPGEPNLPLNGGNTVWYSWKPTASRGHELSILNGVGNLLHLFKGDALPALQLVGAVTNFSGQAAGASFLVSEGEQYYLRADTLQPGGSLFQIRITPATTNDMFASRASLPVNSSLQYNLIGATLEPGEPLHNDDPAAQRSLWYEWRAPRSGGFYLPGGETFAIYQGDSPTNLIAVPSVFQAGRRTFRAEKDAPYQVVVYQTTNNYRSGFVTISPGPLNDEFENAVPLQLGELSTGTLGGITVAPGEPQLAPVTGTLWYSWRAEERGAFSAVVTGAVVRVYHGSSLPDLQPLDDHRVPGVHPPNVHSFRAEADEVVHLAVAPFGSFTVSVVPTATNDDFHMAALFPPEGSALLSGPFLATVEKGEPQPWEGNFKNTLWWRWTAQVTGGFRLLVASSPGQTNGETGIHIYHGGSLETLTSVASDEAQGPVAVDFYAQADTEYKFAFGQTAEGASGLQLKLQSAPPSDSFAQPVVVQAPSTTLSEIGAASREPAEPAWGNTNQGTLWFRWKPEAAGRYLPQAFETNSGPLLDLAIFSGNELTALEHLSGPGNYLFPASAGVEYSIAVALPARTTKQSVTLAISERHQFDDFNSAYIMPGALTSYWSSTTFASTVESGEPLVSSNQFSVWASWTAPRSGRFAVTQTSAAIPPFGLEVFAGDNFENLLPVHEFSLLTTNKVEFQAEEGRTYHVRVSSFAARHFSLYIFPVGTAAAFKVIPLAGTNISTNVPAGFSTQSRTFLSWTAPGDGLLTVASASGGRLGFYHLHQPTISSNVLSSHDLPPSAVNLSSNVFAVEESRQYLIELVNYYPPGRTLPLRLELRPVSVTNINEPLRSTALRGGNDFWQTTTEGFHSSPDALAVTLPSQKAAWIEALLPGPSTLEFWVKTAGPDAAFFDVATDSSTMIRVLESTLRGNNQWQRQIIQLPRATNVVRWTYRNASSTTSATTATAVMDSFRLIPDEPTPVALQLPPAGLDENRFFRLNIPLEGQRRYMIQFSLDLQNWYDWNIVSSATPDMLSIPLPATNPAMFFRIRSL